MFIDLSVFSPCATEHRQQLLGKTEGKKISSQRKPPAFIGC